MQASLAYAGRGGEFSSQLVETRPGQPVFHALCVLDQAILACVTSGPLKPPQPGVRLALAFLYSLSAPPRSRDAYDELWRTLLGRSDAGPSRQTWAGTQLAGICHSIGVAQTVELMDAIARARGNETPAARAYRLRSTGSG
ncbi:MAG: hypothetical protein EON55_25700 [Alphaproteobacteria bacterium]|nr:MAG: hypothetical protein EON55_25700 [Alphaproteobacteria bacterium]